MGFLLDWKTASSKYDQELKKVKQEEKEKEKSESKDIYIKRPKSGMTKALRRIEKVMDEADGAVDEKTLPQSAVWDGVFERIADAMSDLSKSMSTVKAALVFLGSDQNERRDMPQEFPYNAPARQLAKELEKIYSELLDKKTEVEKAAGRALKFRNYYK